MATTFRSAHPREGGSLGRHRTKWPRAWRPRGGHAPLGCSRAPENKQSAGSIQEQIPGLAGTWENRSIPALLSEVQGHPPPGGRRPRAGLPGRGPPPPFPAASRPPETTSRKQKAPMDSQGAGWCQCRGQWQMANPACVENHSCGKRSGSLRDKWRPDEGASGGPGGAAHQLSDLGQVTSLLWASVSSSVKWG